MLARASIQCNAGPDFATAYYGKNFMIKTAVLTYPAGDPGWPLCKIAGLTLVERNLMGLHNAGIERAHLFCDPEILNSQKDYFADRSDRRLPDVQLHPLDELEAFDVEGLAVVLDGRYVYSTGLLKDAVSLEKPASYTTAEGEPANISVVSRRMFENLEPAPIPAGAFIQKADAASGREQAKRLIFKSLVKPTDGYISMYLNRPVSTRLSWILTEYPVGPNPITVFVLLVGLASGILPMLGTYAGFVCGGILYHLASVLDGVDGEIARVKYLGSRFGEWFDTVCDDLTKIAYLIGITVGTYRCTTSSSMVLLGVAAISLCLISSAITYLLLAVRFKAGTTTSFDWNFKRPENQGKASSRLLSTLDRIARRDGYALLFMIFALANVAWLAHPVMIIGVTAFLSVLLRQMFLQSSRKKVLRNVQ
jgi:phosphatidylglycerophosphate synthase